MKGIEFFHTVSQLIIKIDTLLFFRNQQSEDDALTFSASANCTFSLYGSRCVPKFSASGPPRVLKHLSFLLEGVKKALFLCLLCLCFVFQSDIFNVSSRYQVLVKLSSVQDLKICIHCFCTSFIRSSLKAHAGLVFFYVCFF